MDDLGVRFTDKPVFVLCRACSMWFHRDAPEYTCDRCPARYCPECCDTFTSSIVKIADSNNMQHCTHYPNPNPCIPNPTSYGEGQ